MALTQKLLRGSTLTVTEQGVKLVMMFVTTPLMVVHLGERDYGIWLLALTIIGYLRLLDFGVSFTGTRFLGQAIGSENPEKFQQLFRSLSYLYNRLGLLALGATLIIALLLPALFPANPVLKETRWVLLGLGLTTTIRFWTRIFEVVLKSHVRYDLIGITAIAKTLIQGGLIIYFLTNGHGLNTLLIIFIFADILDQTFLFLLSRVLFPEARIIFVRQRPSDIPQLIRYSATATLASVGKALRSTADPLIIGHISGIAAVPVYSIGARFLTVFTDLINAVFGGNFLAAFSQLDGRNDKNSLTRNFLKSIRFSSALTMMGGCVLAIIGPSFILRWVGDSFEHSGKVLFIILIPTVLSLMQYPIWSFFYSQNKQKWLAATNFGGGIFNITLSIILAQKMGFFGVVWATFIEMTIVFAGIVPFLVSRICEISPLSYYWLLLKSAFPVATTAAIYYLVMENFLVPDYFRLALLGTGLGLLILPVVWWTVFSSDDRNHLMKTIFNSGNQRTKPPSK